MMTTLPLKILMVEDNRAEALLLQETLLDAEPGAYELTWDDGVKKALDRLKQACFDAILLDLMLPDSQGLATLEHVQGAAKETPLIIMTGIEDEKLAIRAIRQGAQDYLVKGTADGRSIARAIRYAVDRVKAQKTLRENDMRLRLALDAADAGTWEWDLRTDTQVWSEELWRLYGLEPHSCEPSYETWLQTVHPDDRSKTEHIVRETVHKGIDLNAEWRVRDRDGTDRWLMSRGRPTRDLVGQTVSLIGIVVDITKRKLAEEILASTRAEKAARDMVAVMEEGVVLLDMFGTIVFVNPAMERITGYRASEVVGRNMAIFFPAMFSVNELREVSEKLSDLIHGKPVVLTPFTFLSKEAREVTVVPSSAFIYNAEGKPCSIVLTLRNITQLKKTEDELRRANEYNRGLIETSLDPLLTIGPDGKIMDVNQATEAATGCTRKELIGTDFTDYFTEPKKARAGYRKVFRDGVVRDYPLEIRHRGGGTLSVLYNASVYRDESGEVVGVFAAARDITQRLQIEEERQRLANRVIEIQEEERKNISSMLHDRTGQLLTLARLDLERLHPTDERSRRIIRDVLQWLSEVISTIRDMAVSLRPPLLDNMSIEAALESLINDFSKGSNIQFTVKRQNMIPELDADQKTCLYRVLQEALTNSVKHSGASQVDVAFGAESESLWIEIRDNGKGFDVDARRDRKGIGLLNMRERVHQCGGTFIVSSAVGHGSTIRTVLPLT